MIDLYRLNHFVTVAQLGSFVRAAEELSLSQPALSRSIQALERSAGTRLLERGKGPVTTTAVGATFLVQAEEVLFQAENLEHNLRAVLDGGIGTLRFGIGPASASALIPQLLHDLDARFPGAAVKISVSSVERMREELVANKVEFFIARDRTPDRLDFRISSEELATAHPMFLVREGHPLLSLPSIGVSDLIKYRLAAGSAWSETLAGASRELQQLTPSVELDNYDLLAQLTETTDSVLIASNGFNRFGLVPLMVRPSDFGIPPSRVSLFQLDGRTFSPLATAAVELLRKGLTGAPAS